MIRTSSLIGAVNTSCRMFCSSDIMRCYRIMNYLDQLCIDLLFPILIKDRFIVFIKELGSNKWGCKNC